MKVKSKMYFNKSKESSLDDFLTICEKNDFIPTEDAKYNACYAGYEISVDVEWDLETGDCKILGNAK